jgi:hypothetical protein
LADDWEEFKYKYQNDINSLRPLLNITIYGSYNPPSEKGLLILVKQTLIDKGYANTKIVEDRQNQDSDPLEVSKQCLLFSDVNFLIFTKKGKRFGVIRELAFIAEDDRMRPKINHCVIFVEKVNGSSSPIPPLSISDIRNSRLPCRSFRYATELQEAIVCEAFWHLRRLSQALSARR